MSGFKHFFYPVPVDTPALKIRGIGFKEPMRPTIVNRPQGSGDYLFMYFYQPTRVGTDENAPVCPRHTMMIWEPGVAQFYGNPTRPWAHTWLHCEGSLIGRWVAQNRLPRHQPFQINTPSIVEGTLMELHGELTSHLLPDERIARNLVENWMRKIGRALRGAQAGQGVPEAFLDARRYLDNHYEEPVRLKWLAARANLSVPHFCAEFKRHFRMATIEYLIHVRLQHANYLLRDRNMRIGEVAAQVGYRDPYHFSKLFKKHYGTSPKEMRRRMLESTGSN